jgi:hypothetical protein
VNTTPSTSVKRHPERVLAMVCADARNWPATQWSGCGPRRRSSWAANDREALRLNSEADEHLQMPHKLRERTLWGRYL